MLLCAILYLKLIVLPYSAAVVHSCAIEATLDYTGGDKTRTALTLGIGRKTLYRKLLDYRSDDPAA